MSRDLAILLFSGTADQLQAAGAVASGATAAGRQVRVLATFWAVDAFRQGEFGGSRPVSAEYGVHPASMDRRLREGGVPDWSAHFEVAAGSGRFRLQVDSMALDLLDATAEDLAAIVDGITSLSAFIAETEDSQLVVI